jgi:hypothetical protein
MSKIPSIEKLERYIGATRVNYPDRILTDLYYQHYFPPIQAMADHLGVQVRLNVVYSSTRRAEQVTIEGQNWLVYDQYMGQTMNLLNRILLESEGDRPGLVYIHKILAERLLETGAKPEALFCAKVYDSERAILKGKHLNDELRSLFTVAQEKFYRYHELGHQVYGLEHFSCATVRDHVDALLVGKLAFLRDQSPDMILGAFDSGSPAAFHGATRQEIERDIRDQFESESGIRYRTATLKAFDNKDLHEELFCDVLAADLTLGSWSNADVGTRVLRAIYAGFYHLQALALVNRHFDHEQPKSDRWMEHFVPIQIRSHCLRTHLLFLLELHLQASGSVDDATTESRVAALSIQLMEDQRRYYEVILDPAMKMIGYLKQPGVLARLGQEGLAPVFEERPALADPANSLELDTALEIGVRWLTGLLPDHPGPVVGLSGTD